MNILMVGGAGHVGNIIRPAFEAKHHCTHYDLRPVPGAENRTLVADVNDDAKVAEAFAGVDVVLYLAMGTVNNDRRSVNEIDPAFNVNVRGAYRFFYRGLAAGVRRFVYASTLSIYQQLHRYAGMDESNPPSEWGPYGFSKRVGEFICASASQEYPDATIIALRLCLPSSKEDWPKMRYDPQRQYNHCALGPEDTTSVFLKAAECVKPGFHIVQATGDIEDKRFSQARSRELLGWQPTNH